MKPSASVQKEKVVAKKRGRIALVDCICECIRFEFKYRYPCM